MHSMDQFFKACDFFKKIYHHNRPGAFLFENFQNPAQKLIFGYFRLLPWKIQSDIIVNPHPAFIILINQNHPVRNLKRAKPIIKSLEADKCLFKQVQNCIKSHFRQSLKVMSEGLYGNLHHRALIEQLFLKDLIEENLDQGELGLRAPLYQPHLFLELRVVHYHLVFLKIFSWCNIKKGFAGFVGVFLGGFCCILGILIDFRIIYLFFSLAVHLSIIKQLQWITKIQNSQLRYYQTL